MRAQPHKQSRSLEECSGKPRVEEVEEFLIVEESAYSLIALNCSSLEFSL